MFRILSYQKLTTTAAIALAFLIAVGSGLASDASSTGMERAQGLLDQLPLHFEANQGQMDKQVRFYAQSSEHTVFLTRNEAVLRVATGALSVGLKGSSPAPAIEGLNQLPSRSSYFIGDNPAQWQQRVGHFAKVRYEGVYPGIDLVYYGKGRQLEHDFVVAPASDPSAIAIEFGGAESMEIDSSGVLVLTVGGTEMRFSAPYAYVEAANGERQEVAANYVKTGEREVAFAVGDYDPSRMLVIDPVLSYSTYFGGSNVEMAKAVVVDAAGHIYVTGIRTSPDYPTNGVGLQEPGGGQDDAFLIKLDPFTSGPGGGLLYSSFFGGLRDEEPFAMELDEQGNIYIVGSTFSGNFPTTGNGAQPVRHSTTGDDGTTLDTVSEDGFVVRFHLDQGEPLLKYGTFLSGGGKDAAYGLALENNGHAHVVGYSDSDDGFPLSADTYQATMRGTGDAFYTVLDTVQGGAPVYSTFFGGDDTESGNAVALAPDGTAVLTGWTSSTNFPTGWFTPYETNQQGKGDAFVTKLDSRLPGIDALRYSTYLGGGDLDVGRSLVVDASGRVHVGGYTFSENYPTTAAAIQSANAGLTDLFVTTLDMAKEGGEGLVFSTYIGGSETDVPYRVVMDSAGGLLMTGYTYSDDFPVAGDFYSDTFGGLTDAMLLRLDPDKPAGEVLTCSSYFGGSGIEVGWAVGLDSLDNIYLVGSTSSDEFPVTENAYTGTKPGLQSAFVTKMGPCQISGSGSTGGDTGGASGDPGVTRRGSSPTTGRSSRGGGRGR